MSARRFIGSWALAALLVLVLVAGFNFAVDPYLLFDRPRVAGFNERKPSVATQERMMKLHEVVRGPGYRALILGSSRVDVGLNALHGAWPSTMRPVYNLGLAGADARTELAYLRQALSVNPIKLVVLGLDFEDYLGSPESAKNVLRPAQFERHMALRSDGSSNPDFAWQTLVDQVQALLSLDALKASASTILANRGTGSANLDRSGNLSEAPFRRDVDSDGAYALFGQKNDRMVREYAGLRAGPVAKPDARVDAIDDLNSIIELCEARGIALILVMQPTHVDRLELFEILGQWDRIEAWKRIVTQLVSEHQRAHPTPGIVLWDFWGYDSRSTEAVPAAGDRSTRLKWFWEPAHYTSELGDLMLRRMLGNEAGDYGLVLTPDNVEARLMQTREAQAQYRNEHAQTYQRLLRLVQAYKAAH